SSHPSGDTILATLTASCPEFTRPAYSSMRFGLLPAAAITVGFSIKVGMFSRSYLRVLQVLQVLRVLRVLQVHRFSLGRTSRTRRTCRTCRTCRTFWIHLQSGSVKAIEISAPGYPDVLRLVNRPDPVPGPGEVVIEVEASGVNRPDLMQ